MSKLVFQEDEKDCGCACLSTIFKIYGVNLKLSTIRRLSNTDKNGTSLLALSDVAKMYNFDSFGAKLNDKKEILKLTEPVISYVIIENTQHFVVILEIKGKKIKVFDPARGLKNYTFDEFKDIFTGILLFVRKTDKVEKIKSEFSFMKFTKIISSNILNVIWVLFFSILITIISIFSSYYFKFLIDKNNDVKIFYIVILFLFISILGVLFEYIRYKFVIKLCKNIDKSLILEFYNHLIELPISYFDKKESSDIITRFFDTIKIRQGLANLIISTFMDFFMIFIAGIILYFQNNFLFKISLIPIIIYLIIINIFIKKVEINNRNLMEHNSKITLNVLETINNIYSIKSYVLEEKNKKEFKINFEEFLNKFIKSEDTQNLLITLKKFVQVSFNIIIFGIGMIYVVNEKMSLGTLITFNALLTFFNTPLENIINSQTIYQNMIIASNRIDDILESDVENKNINYNKIKDLQDNKIQNEKEDKYYKINSIKLENIYFKYNYMNILEDINCEFEINNIYYIFGKSGSGKSTLLKLIMRFYTQTSGNIFINDKNLNTLDINIYRNKIAYISAQMNLFNKTIFENLKINKNIKEEDIIKISKEIGIYDEIMNFPLKFDTIIEENSKNLSLGQKQRLLILRGLLINPDVIILDEVTNNLDFSSKNMILNFIKSLKNKIIIIVNHEDNVKEDNIYKIDNKKLIKLINN